MTTTELVATLRSAGEELRALVESLPADRLERPEADGWTARQVLAHLADFELIAAVRVRMVLTQDRPALASYDQDGFTKRFGRLEPAAEALERFEVNRLATTRVLESLGDADWERPGLHPVRGEETLRQTVEKVAEHDRGPLEQLRAAAGG
jgi:uncharacterized damage-inducible protein DinB